jgi:4-hydroxymandelate oxidase
MTSRSAVRDSRRALLRFIAGSPLVYGLGSLTPLARAFAQEEFPIETLDQVLNVFDMHTVAQARMLPGHYAYMAQAADDQAMLNVNREGFARIQLRPRRLVDTTNVDLSVELFGQRFDIPIFIAPCGAQGAFHAEGEVAVARAARSRNALQILSTVTNFSVEDVTAARGAPIWFQLYPTSDWELTRAMIKRAEAAGCTALALTVDIPARNLEPIVRFNRDGNAVCQACHEPGLAGAYRAKPMFDAANLQGMRMGIAGLNWDYVELLKETTSMRVLVKGIATGEDAARCIEHGADGVIVSNHGGRAEDSGRASIDCLPEVVAAVRGRVPVIVDSGFRRGTDIFKALALGATGIGIGRPYLWGLGAFGEAGVDRVLEILTRELRIVMQQMGTASLRDISRDYVQL